MNTLVKNIALLASVTIGVASHAFANEDVEGGGFYIAPSMGYSLFDNDVKLQNDFSYGVGAGYKFTSHWATELAYTYVDSEEKKSHIDVGVDYWEIDGLYYFNPIAKYKPFVVLGVGRTNYNYDGSAKDVGNNQVVAGVGVAYALSKEVEIKADIRGLFSQDAKDDTIIGTDFNVGALYYFGELGRVAKAAPAPAPVAAPAVVPTPMPVVEKDTDADGVMDSQDKCADTKAGAKVNADGCYEELKAQKDFTMYLNFAVNKDQIRPEVRNQVADLANFLKEYPNTRVVIEGHTDSVGSDAANKALSQRRANSVKTSLLNDYGIEADRVTAIGYGESQPKATNDTAAGQAENRRVVAKITQK